MRTVLPLILLLAACSRETPRDAASDARDIAAVEAAQRAKPPVRPVELQPILYPDVVAGKLAGAGCNFVAEGGGMGGVALAQADRAVIKIDGKLVTLAADKGSARLPQGSWSRYTGKQYALSLARIDDGKQRTTGATEMLGGLLVLSDPDRQVVYRAKGDLQCRAQ